MTSDAKPAHAGLEELLGLREARLLLSGMGVGFAMEVRAQRGAHIGGDYWTQPHGTVPPRCDPWRPLLPRPICRNVLEDFCCINFGGFSRGFSWRIFLGAFSHKNEEKKSGEKIREKIRRLKNKNPRKIRSAESRP